MSPEPYGRGWYTAPASLWRLAELSARLLVPSLFVAALGLLALRHSPTFAGTVGYLGLWLVLLARSLPAGGSR